MLQYPNKILNTSIITSMAFKTILVQYQYSIEILNYFSVSLSVFQKNNNFKIKIKIWTAFEGPCLCGFFKSDVHRS